MVCPGAQVTFTSTAQNLFGSNLWLLPSGTCVLPQNAGACNGTTMTCGPYTATNADPGNASIPCLTSTLSMTATSSMTSSVIKVGTRSLAGQSVIINNTQITVQSIGENDIFEVHCLHYYCMIICHLTSPSQPLLEH